MQIHHWNSQIVSKPGFYLSRKTVSRVIEVDDKTEMVMQADNRFQDFPCPGDFLTRGMEVEGHADHRRKQKSGEIEILPVPENGLARYRREGTKRSRTDQENLSNRDFSCPGKGSAGGIEVEFAMRFNMVECRP